MTVSDPSGRPDLEHPDNITDAPAHDSARPAPTPEHHPDDGGLPGDGVGTPGAESPQRG